MHNLGDHQKIRAGEQLQSSGAAKVGGAPGRRESAVAHCGDGALAGLLVWKVPLGPISLGSEHFLLGMLLAVYVVKKDTWKFYNSSP